MVYLTAEAQLPHISQLASNLLHHPGLNMLFFLCSPPSFIQKTLIEHILVVKHCLKLGNKII